MYGIYATYSIYGNYMYLLCLLYTLYLMYITTNLLLCVCLLTLFYSYTCIGEGDGRCPKAKRGFGRG